MNRYGEWLLVLTTLIAASGWLFTKEAIAQMPLVGFIGLRFLLGGLLLLPFCFWTKQTIAKKQLSGALLTGLLQMLQLLLWVIAIGSGSALGTGAFITSLSILMVPLVVWLLYKERPAKVFWYALPIAIMGLGSLSLSNQWAFSSGQLWFLISAIMMAIYFSVNSRIAPNIAVFPLTCVQLFCTGVGCTLISLCFETWPDQIDAPIWGWFFASVLIATSLRFILQTTGQKYVHVGNAAVIMILEPIWTLLLSVVFYDESMPVSKWIGCLLILVALLIYRGYIFLLARKARFSEAKPQ